MGGHVLQTALPFGDVEVGVVEPGVTVAGGTAPCSAGHVVVEVHVDLLLSELGGDGVVYLWEVLAVACLLYISTYFKPGRRVIKLRIILDHLLVHGSAIRLTQSFLERIPNRDIPAIILDIINQLDGKREANNVHVQTLDLLRNRRNALILKPLGNHDLASARPVDAYVGEVCAGGVLNPLA